MQDINSQSQYFAQVTSQTRPLPRDAILCVTSVEHLITSQQLQSEMAMRFNKNGFVIIESLGGLNRTQFINLKKLFGSQRRHEKADLDGILIIDAENPNSVNVRDVEKTHQPHTDDAYSSDPSDIVTMLCQTPAPAGGETVLVSGKDAYEFIDNEMHRAENGLFADDCMTIGRKLPGQQEMEKASHPVFKRVADGRIAFRWRSYDSYILALNPLGELAYHLINDYFKQAENQYVFRLKRGQMIIINNSAVAHGRLPYFPGHQRVLWRINYHNDGVMAEQLHCGFQPKIDRRHPWAIR